MRTILLLAGVCTAVAFAPLNSIYLGKTLSRSLAISSPAPVARVSRKLQLACTLASPDDTAAVVEEGGEEKPLNRKERRRMNKTSRNRERNRLVDPDTKVKTHLDFARLPVKLVDPKWPTLHRACGQLAIVPHE